MVSYDELVFWGEHIGHLSIEVNQNADARQQGSSKHIHFEIPLPSPCDSSYPTSPLATLPEELLCKIFELSLYKRASTSPSGITFVSAKGPTLLAQICRYWRAIAINNPALWSSIYVFRITENSLHRVRLWLIRSGPAYPLSVGFDRPEKHKPSALLENEVMRLYSEQCLRWHAVSFMPLASSEILAKLAGNPQAVPELRQMELDCYKIPERAKHIFWSVLSSSQNLRTISLTGVHIVDRNFQEITPWGQLTAISFTKVNIDALWGILPHCSSLQHLDFTPDGTRMTEFGPHSPPVTLPSLRRLHLYMAIFKASTILDLLSAPNLRELRIVQYEGRHPRPDALHNFLSRSGCALEVLQIVDVMLAEEDLIAYIASPMLFSVTCAKFDGMEFTTRIIESLVLDPPEPEGDNDQNNAVVDVGSSALTGIVNATTARRSILPSLQSLKLGMCRFSDKMRDRQLVEEMISTRFKHGKNRLKEVEMSVNECGARVMSKKFVYDMWTRFGVLIKS